MSEQGQTATTSAHGNEDLARSFQKIRSRTEFLSSPLSPEDQSIQSMPDASPTKWHRAHTSWFFETFVLRPFCPGYQVFHSDYDLLFNSYYNGVGRQFPRERRGLISRPGACQISDYREAVDRALSQLIDELDARRDAGEIRALIALGLHHEQQHQELLLTDIKHVLWNNPLKPAYRQRPHPPSTTEDLRDLNPSPSLSFVAIPGGVIDIGYEGSSFHFDNERPRHQVILRDYQLAKAPLNNADVFTFIHAGGYDDPLLWLSDGWSFRQAHSLQHPLYWMDAGKGHFEHFTLHGVQPIDGREAACHLTYFEADAMARFFGARLPTEQEWEHAAHLCNPESSPFDAEDLRPRHHTNDVGELKQLLSGVWEWTKSPYVAYPGYEVPSGAVGEYNGKFMHNQMVLRGGSYLTPEGHTRRTYRNFFPGSAQWQCSGVRLAKESSNR
jgi:ergothioneine biosynthesis protein EgtB